MNVDEILNNYQQILLETSQLKDIAKLRYYISKIVECSSDEESVPPSLRNINDKSDTSVITAAVTLFMMMSRNPDIRERLNVSLATNLSFEDTILDILQLVLDAIEFGKEDEKNVSN